MTRRALAVAIALLVLAAPAQAPAFVYYECLGKKLRWEGHGDGITMRASGTSFPEGSVWQTALASVRDRINQNPSRFDFSISWNEGSVARKNGQNEVWATDDEDLLDGAPARTLSRYKCIDFGAFETVELIEADVVFDSEGAWEPGEVRSALTAYDGPGRSLRTTGLHEFGHSLGLAHSKSSYQIMGSDVTHIHANGNVSRAYFGEDAGDGAVFLYGEEGHDVEDVSLSHWKYGGSEGEYSTHVRTEMYRLSGPPLPSVAASDGGRRYLVDKGQIVILELTYENNGRNTQFPSIAYYLSGNSTISTGDLFLGSVEQLEIQRNKVATLTVSLLIPAWVPSQDLYIGAVIDYDQQIFEVTGNNNATYVPIRVLPQDI